MDQRFGKLEKLKSKKHIDLLFAEGKNFKSYPLKLIYAPIPNYEKVELKTGVSVPKKLIKTAVQRNRIKRLMREAFRKNKYLVASNLANSHAFMFIYISRDEIDHKKMEKNMMKLLKLFAKKKPEE